MKILFIADSECAALWEHFRPERIAGIDLIVSSGDLKKEYLEFLVTLSSKPLLYIPGNHDTGYTEHPPEGCECIDDSVYVYRGVRIAGLGGCKRYSPGEYQYTEAQMRRRVYKLRRAIKKAGGIDIFVSHASLTGYGDANDRAHLGFDCFAELLDEFRPSYMIHGHVHRSYGWNITQNLEYNGIPIINAFERYVLEIPDKV